MRRLLLPVLFLAACSAPDRSREVLEQQGYTNVEITGWSAFSCSDDDGFSTGFTALSPADKPVRGAVCCGLLTKACTIRFE